jgi:sugar phosphate isomerase/epimerase
MIQLGFVSAVLAEQSWEEVLETAAELGYSCVELLCWPRRPAERKHAGVSHIDVAALDAGTARHIRRKCAETGVSISALGYYPNMMDEDEEKAQAAAEHLGKVIDAAAELGIGSANTFIGRPQHADVESAFERFRRLWPPIVRRAEARQVRLGIENCPLLFTAGDWPGGGNLAFSPAIWRRMFAEIPSAYFGLNYDPSHLVWQQIDPIRPIHEFSDRLFHLHLKDAKLLPDALNDTGILAPPLDYHVPKLPGLGDVDWGAFFSALTDVGYRGPACVEVEDPAYEGSPETRRASLVQCRRYLRQFLPG